jgi:hypothetical protein
VVLDVLSAVLLMAFVDPPLVNPLFIHDSASLSNVRRSIKEAQMPKD